jgi:hypothetical protein
MAAGIWGQYSSTATFGGAALGAAGVLVLALDRAPAWAYAAGCTVAGAGTMAVIRSAALIIPLVVGLAGLLLGAAAAPAVEAFGSGRQIRAWTSTR